MCGKRWGTFVWWVRYLYPNFHMDNWAMITTSPLWTNSISMPINYYNFKWIFSPPFWMFDCKKKVLEKRAWRWCRTWCSSRSENDISIFLNFFLERFCDCCGAVNHGLFVFFLSCLYYNNNKFFAFLQAFLKNFVYFLCILYTFC